MAGNQELGSRTKTNGKRPGARKSDKQANGRWEKPVLEDVSGKILAQPSFVRCRV